MNNWIPDFIIEKLKEMERLKQEREYENARPRIYAPPPMPPQPPAQEDEETTGGPIIIDINSYEIIDEDD